MLEAQGQFPPLPFPSPFGGPVWNSSILWTYWRSNFETTSYIRRENQGFKVYENQENSVTGYTDSFMISFVFFFHELLTSCYNKF